MCAACGLRGQRRSLCRTHGRFRMGRATIRPNRCPPPSRPRHSVAPAWVNAAAAAMMVAAAAAAMRVPARARLSLLRRRARARQIPAEAAPRHAHAMGIAQVCMLSLAIMPPNWLPARPRNYRHGFALLQMQAQARPRRASFCLAAGNSHHDSVMCCANASFTIKQQSLLDRTPHCVNPVDLRSTVRCVRGNPTFFTRGND